MVPFPPLIFGTANLAALAPADAIHLLDGIYERGCAALDLSPIYSRGMAEPLAGEWLASRRLHGKVLVITKAGLSRIGPSLERSALLPDIERSLRNLRCHCLDVLLLHRDDPTVPLERLFDTLDGFRRDGKVQHFGVSNWSHERLAAANDFARQRGVEPFIASSPQFSLAIPAEAPWPGCLSIAGDEAAIQFYTNSDIPVFAWSPLASGFLSGRFTEDDPSKSNDFRAELVRRVYATRANQDRLARAADLARAENRTVPQIALAYVLSQPFRAHAIVETSSAAC